jgi:hypothetical protein
LVRASVGQFAPVRVDEAKPEPEERIADAVDAFAALVGCGLGDRHLALD